MRCLTLLSLLLSTLCLNALPAGRTHGGRELSTATRLVGTWHSTSVSGDAIGVAVDDIVATFHANRNFKATVNMNLGGPNVYQGSFDAKRNHVTLHTQSDGAMPCQITFQGPKQMTLVGERHGVTAVFARGKAPASSGGWF